MSGGNVSLKNAIKDDTEKWEQWLLLAVQHLCPCTCSRAAHIPATTSSSRQHRLRHTDKESAASRGCAQPAGDFRVKEMLQTPLSLQSSPPAGVMACAHSLMSPVELDRLFVAGFWNLTGSGGETVAVDGQCGPSMGCEDSRVLVPVR